MQGLFEGIVTRGANIRRGLIVPRGILSSKTPQKKMYFFPATIDSMAETLSFTTECHKQCRSGSTSNSVAVDKNLILLQTYVKL